VLVPLYEVDGETRVILTKRPETMPSHRGEIAFPGGGLRVGVDPTPRDTALREAEEEIGLRPELVEVVAELDTIGTVASRFTITPFVGLLRGRPALHADPREVEAILEVPLSELLDDEVYREEHWGPDFTISFYELVGETVWGATARILTAFLTHLIAAGGR
jgi:8-oxo-dGTP pyrophosphatase MutT (NUDIX family)